MTEQDWDIYIGEWELSLLCPRDVPLDRSPILDVPKNSTKKPAKEGDQDAMSYVRIGRSTAKAHFYITEESMSGTFGFWCPKSFKANTDNKSISLPKWMKTNIIEFT